MNEHQPYFHDFSALDELCADRPPATPELHPSNDYYGQASVLKRYAGLDAERESLRAVIEHGISLSDKMWEVDRNAEFGLLFSPSKWRARIHRRLTDKLVIPIGFGFLYAQRLLDRVARPVDCRRGTLAFPCHSTHTIRAKFDHQDYARRLASLPDFMHPVSVCIYWKNYLQGEHLPYQQQGLQVVSAGHMYDSEFLLRLYDLCRVHRFATANEVGSHLFLAVSSGCRFVFTDSQPISWETPANEVDNCSRHNGQFQSLANEARRLFGNRLDENGGLSTGLHQRDFVARLTGEDDVLSPRELRQLIRRAARQDRIRRLIRWPGDRTRRLGLSIAKRLPWRRAV